MGKVRREGPPAELGFKRGFSFLTKRPYLQGLSENYYENLRLRHIIHVVNICIAQWLIDKQRQQLNVHLASKRTNCLRNTLIGGYPTQRQSIFWAETSPDSAFCVIVLPRRQGAPPPDLAPRKWRYEDETFLDVAKQSPRKGL